jgi:hypothetical protein
MLCNTVKQTEWTNSQCAMSSLKLSGWNKSRRVVVLRRADKTDLALSRKTKNEPGEQIELLMPDKDVQAWEYAVLVTSST